MHSKMKRLFYLFEMFEHFHYLNMYISLFNNYIIMFNSVILFWYRIQIIIIRNKKTNMFYLNINEIMQIH